MASAPTNINSGVLATGHVNLSYGGANSGGLFGAIPILLSAAVVGASQSGVVWCSVKVPFKCRYRLIAYSAQASTGTASFDVYNSTTTATLLASTSIANGGVSDYSSTLGTATEIITKDDVVQLRVTTAGASSISELAVTLFVTPLGEIANPLPNSSYTS